LRHALQKSLLLSTPSCLSVCLTVSTFKIGRVTGARRQGETWAVFVCLLGSSTSYQKVGFPVNRSFICPLPLILRRTGAFLLMSGCDHNRQARSNAERVCREASNFHQDLTRKVHQSRRQALCTARLYLHKPPLSCLARALPL
jgi:hypothetical protein